MTWIVATVVIIVILILSFFIASKMGAAKEIVEDAKGIFTGEYKVNDDLLEGKSVFAYFLIEDVLEKQDFYEQIQGDKFQKINTILEEANE